MEMPVPLTKSGTLLRNGETEHGMNRHVGVSHLNVRIAVDSVFISLAAVFLCKNLSSPRQIFPSILQAQQAARNTNPNVRNPRQERTKMKLWSYSNDREFRALAIILLVHLIMNLTVSIPVTD